MAERNRRGIKAEMEESREILEAYVEENKTLVALLARGRALGADPPAEFRGRRQSRLAPHAGTRLTKP